MQHLRGRRLKVAYRLPFGKLRIDSSMVPFDYVFAFCARKAQK